MAKKEVIDGSLSWQSFALAASIFAAVYSGLAALFAMSALKVPGFSDEVFVLLKSIYPMITATPAGILVALGIGLACGAVCGGIFGWLYNAVVSFPMNLSIAERWGRLVAGAVLFYLGEYVGGLIGGIVIVLAGISVMEAIVGYCYLIHVIKR